MSHETPVQPKLTDLLARFLNKQAQAQTDGLLDFDPKAEVTPFEAGSVQPIDAQLAWEQAVAVAGHFQPGIDTGTWSAPPHWVGLVAAHEPVVALAFCLGNFPQLVRNFHLILQKAKPADLQPSAGRQVPVPALVDWAQNAAAKKKFPEMLLALGALRLAKNFEQAAGYVKANDAVIPQEWRAAWTNEKAALAWHQGQTEPARALWNAMEPNVPVLFNRGMADLFLGNTSRARTNLNEVVAKLPETSPWHPLARLYPTLGKIRPGRARSAAE